MKKSFIKYVAAICLSATCLFLTATNAKAAWVEDTDNNVSYTDSVYISSNYAGEWNYGGANYITVYLDDNGDRVTNVKSSSSKLLAKKTKERVVTETSTDYDYELAKEISTTNTSYETACISFFAKKKGTYKVTFDVVDKAGTVKCTKTIKVYADATVSSSSAIKYIKYAGKSTWEYYPYTTKKSGKLSVKLNKGYSLVSIEVGKINKNGEMVYKKVKNNKKIKLATSSKYSYSYSYSGDSYSYNDSYNYNLLFPQTNIKVTVKNKKTGETSVYSEYLHTLSKK